MAKVICDMANCVHRSKRPMRTWRYKDGSRCYGCLLETVAISRIFDPDGDCEGTVGEENMAHCAEYEPEEGTEECQDEED